MGTLPRSFYARDTVRVARDLLGHTLVRRIKGNRATLAGVITETEAYMAGRDPASHAHNGRTERNRAMFSTVGCAYVYFTYGMHYCVNAVAYGPREDAGAVLIRALVPSMGQCIMSENRGSCTDSIISDGPAKLTQAMQIRTEMYGADLTRRGELFITDTAPPRRRVTKGSRIGIRNGTDLLWNFRLA